MGLPSSPRTPARSPQRGLAPAVRGALELTRDLPRSSGIRVEVVGIEAHLSAGALRDSLASRPLGSAVLSAWVASEDIGVRAICQ